VQRMFKQEGSGKMNFFYTTLILLALTDYLLTVFWIYRWNSSIYVRQFKYKLPIELIESNPVIRYTSKHFGLYPGVVVGYALLFTVQIALLNLNVLLGLVVMFILAWAIQGHIKNNLNTSNKHIIKITMEYNKQLFKKKTKRGKTSSSTIKR